MPLAMSLVGKKEGLEPGRHQNLPPREGHGFGGMLDSMLPLLCAPGVSLSGKSCSCLLNNQSRPDTAEHIPGTVSATAF